MTDLKQDDELEVDIAREPRALLSVRSFEGGDPEPSLPRALLEARQGNPDQTMIWGNAGKPILVAPGRVETLARVRADDPLAQTIVCALDAPDPLPAGIYLFAIIEWGTDGVTHRAVCDFLLGQQITVSGSWIQVTGGNEAGSAASAMLGASLAYGSARGTAVVPTRTLRHGAIPAAGTVTFAVPRYAVDFRYYRRPVTLGCSLEFLDVAGAMIYESAVAANALQERAVPIAGDCTQVRVRVPVGPTALAAGRAMFGLAL